MGDKTPPEDYGAETSSGVPDRLDSSANKPFDHKVSSDAPIAHRLGGPTLYMLLGNFFTLAVGLPLQIYVARVLGAAGVGVYGILEAAMMTVSGLLGFGVSTAVVRFLPEHLARREYGEVHALVWASALFTLGVGSLAYGALLLLLSWIGVLWPSMEGYHKEIWIMGLFIPLSLFMSFLQQGLRGFQNIRSIVVGSSMIQLVMKAFLTVGVLTAGLGLTGYMTASVAATFFGVIWLSYNLGDEIRKLPDEKPNISSLTKWCRYAIAAYSGSLLNTMTSGLDRYLVGAFIGSNAVGILVVVRQLQALPERFNQMLLVIGAPLFSAARGTDNRTERQHVYQLITDWVVRSSLPLVLFLWLFGRDLLSLYGAGFADEGTVPLQVFVAAQFFSLACGPCGNLAMMSGLEWQAVRLAAINTVVFVAATVLLIREFGVTGVALAYALSVGYLNGMLMVLIRRKLFIRWWSRRYLEWLAQFAAVLVVAIVALSLRPALNVVELATCLVAMYAAAIGATFLRGLHEDDKELLRYVRRAIRSQISS